MCMNEALFTDILEDLLDEHKSETILKQYFPNVDNLLEQHLITYGEEFVERLSRFGMTEKGEKLVLRQWTKEYAATIGDLRIHHVITAGNAQIGKSLFNMLLLIDFLIIAGLNALWFYPSKQQVDALVPEVFSKIVLYYVQNLENELLTNTGRQIKLIKPTDRQLASRFQVKGATAIFSYASTSGKSDTPTNTGLATVGASASSISASILFIDERSQISPEAIAILPRRLDAGRIPTQPVREVGTFGSGLGIEQAVDNAKHKFYPHFTCDNCKKEVPLNPKGCLLKADSNGKFLSETGRPKNWFYKDEKDKVETAYFACSCCGYPISREKRMNAYFKCENTGVKLQKFRDSLPTDLEAIYAMRDSVAIHLSPLLRDTKYNLAKSLIHTGITTDSTRDFQQQLLGFSSENDNSRVTFQMLMAAKGINRTRKRPSNLRKAYGKADMVLGGIDQGRQEDFLTICKYWINKDKSLTTIQRIEQSERQIIFCGAINRKEINEYFRIYAIDHCFMDNEPDRQGAFDLSQKLELSPVDQKPKIPQLIKDIEVSTGGIEIQALGIDNSFFQDMALNGFAGEYVLIPDWNLQDRSIYSPARHFMSVQRNEENKWERAKDKIDDLWFSYMMCEACFYWKAKGYLDYLARRDRNDWYKYV